MNRTRPTTVGIGERRRPDPGGKPGFVRVDTVHQGDRDREKGVYDINLIDEVTQFEHVGAVAAISEAFLLPVLEEMLVTLPFVVLGFHADNGSEYINHRVAALLNKLHIPDFTKSRARRSNDNALVEGKNASVVRKWLGHDHIPQRFAPQVNAFAQGVLTPYLTTTSLPVRHRGARRRRQDPPPVSPTGRGHSLREAEVPARRGALPQARRDLRRTRQDRLRDVRPAREPLGEPRARRAVPGHRPCRERRGLRGSPSAAPLKGLRFAKRQYAHKRFFDSGKALSGGACATLQKPCPRPPRTNYDAGIATRPDRPGPQRKPQPRSGSSSHWKTLP